MVEPRGGEVSDKVAKVFQIKKWITYHFFSEPFSNRTGTPLSPAKYYKFSMSNQILGVFMFGQILGLHCTQPNVIILSGSAKYWESIMSSQIY